MAAGNTTDSFGWVTRSLHWTTAVLIFAAIPLGAIANRWGIATEGELATKVWLFSFHKTVGVAIFWVASVRIIWALTQPRPGLLNAEKRMESFVAETVHWALYLSLVLVPLSGWIGHAASEGFAPIWWPFGQGLPLVPKSVGLHEFMGSLHWFWSKILVASLILHIAGALKHHFVDRDDTLRRMANGTPAGSVVTVQQHAGPALVAATVFAALLGLTFVTSEAEHHGQSTAALGVDGDGNWAVQAGTIGITVVQFGAPIAGEFANWDANIAYDETTGAGQVTAEVDIASLTLGSVTDQAMGADYFDAQTFATATFVADITRTADGSHLAEGTLTLKGVSQPAVLSFDLDIAGKTATMEGTMTLQRLAFGIGTNQPDAGTLGLDVVTTVNLTATRVP